MATIHVGDMTLKPGSHCWHRHNHNLRAAIDDKVGIMTTVDFDSCLEYS